MGQLMLGQFKGKGKVDESWDSFKDEFDDMKFESDYFKQVSFEEGEEIFEIKQVLTTQRKLNKKKIEFIVNGIWINKKFGCFDTSQKFTKRERAINHFNSEVQFCKWNLQKNKEGKVFDGQRYVWEIKNNKLTGERGWN